MKRTFTVEDVKGNQRFSALTQGEAVTIDLLVDSCNQEQQIPKGYITARKNILHNDFDRGVLLEYINLIPDYDNKNRVFQSVMHNLIEKISRDLVRPYMVKDFVKATAIKLEYFNGDIEKVADCIEGYYKSGKIVPMAETWRERSEEAEKGMVIYYETKSIRAI